MTFLELSRLVTGFNELNSNLAEEYARLLSSTEEWNAEQSRLVKAAEEAFASDEPEIALMAAMGTEPTISLAARRLAHLWYTGRLPAAGTGDVEFVSEQSYFDALIWRTARAHPPGISGGYSGHWRYMPDG